MIFGTALLNHTQNKMFNNIRCCVSTDKPLISGEASRKIFDFIKGGGNVAELSQYDVHPDEIEQLSLMYKKKVEQIPASPDQPRYLHFYYLLKDKVPEITWSISGYKNGRPIVNFNLPLLGDLQPSILSILLDRVVIVYDALKLPYKYKIAKSLPVDMARYIENFMDNTEVIYPNETNMHRIVEWIKTARSGQKVTIFINTCPDYAAEPIGNSKKMYRHTFKFLGSGIGQIAKRILGILPALKQLCEDLQINPDIIITIADYEAFSDSTLKRMNLTKSEFLKKVDQSRLVFEQMANKVIPVKTFMFTDLCGGEEPWIKKTNEVMEYFTREYFGHSEIDKGIFLTIAKHRKALYKNWFNLNDSIEQYTPIAMSQAVEYATIGFYITKIYPNCLLLGADSVDFAEFYNFYKIVPNLYFKRFYC